MADTSDLVKRIRAQMMTQTATASGYARLNRGPELRGILEQAVAALESAPTMRIEVDADAVLEAAIARMGWPEITAFHTELHKGQDVYEDAGGYWMRAIRRLFGLPEKRDVVTNYREAARAALALVQPQGKNNG